MAAIFCFSFTSLTSFTSYISLTFKLRPEPGAAPYGFQGAGFLFHGSRGRGPFVFSLFQFLFSIFCRVPQWVAQREACGNTLGYMEDGPPAN